eukprot:scaffold1419_cov410-Prasinococcus_capsulatus_cf.AAC.9
MGWISVESTSCSSEWTLVAGPPHPKLNLCGERDVSEPKLPDICSPSSQCCPNLTSNVPSGARPRSITSTRLGYRLARSAL